MVFAGLNSSPCRAGGSLRRCYLCVPIFEGGIDEWRLALFIALNIQAPHGCEPLGTLKYPIGWIEGPDREDRLGVRNDNQHPHPALRRLKDMGDGLCPPPGQ